LSAALAPFAPKRRAVDPESKFSTEYALVAMDLYGRFTPCIGLFTVFSIDCRS